MKKFISGFLVSLICVHVNAQCPAAPLTLSTQTQIDNFTTDYPGCTVIPDGIDLKIMGNNISDLSPLSQITEIQGVLEIRNCPLLTNLNGLNNITTLGNDPLDGFILRDLPALNSVTDLTSLQKITGEFTIRTCNNLSSLSGLNTVDSVFGSVIIRDNAMLVNFAGLESLKYVGETLEIVENSSLNDVSALSNLNTIIGGPEGGIFIENNATLTSLSGLGNSTTTAAGDLYIALNGDLVMCSVPVVCNYLANPPQGAIITLNTNLTGCNSEQEILAACTFAGIKSKQEVTSHLIFPNPANDLINISPADSGKISVYDFQGKFVTVLRSNSNTYSVAELEAGFYTLVIGNNDGQKVHLRLLIAR